LQLGDHQPALADLQAFAIEHRPGLVARKVPEAQAIAEPALAATAFYRRRKTRRGISV